MKVKLTHLNYDTVTTQRKTCFYVKKYIFFFHTQLFSEKRENSFFCRCILTYLKKSNVCHSILARSGFIQYYSHIGGTNSNLLCSLLLSN